MNKALLVTRPNHDSATNYLFHWAGLVIGLACRKAFRVIDLSGNKANKVDFTARVSKTNPIFIFFNGHGSKTKITGQNEETLVSIKENLNLLKNRIIFARTCDSAARLGPKSISSGTKAFVGYRQSFIFMSNPKKATRPLTDKTAALFLKPSNLVATTLLKGHTILEADTRAKKAFRKNIRKLLTSETKKEDTSALRFLFWDLRHQICLGDPDARL